MCAKTSACLSTPEDLANIVRRRGYKAVGRLLADLEIEPSVKGKGNEVSNLEVSNGSNFASNSTSHASKVEPLHNGSARPVEHSSSDGSNEPVAPKSLVGRLKDHEILARQDGDVEITAKNDKLDGHSLDAYDAGLGSLTEKDTEEQTLHKRASHFVKTGKLDFIMQDFGEEEDGEEDVGDDDYYEYSSEEEDDENEQKSAEAIALEKAAKLRAKLLPFIKGTMSGKMNNEHDDGLLRVMQKPTKFEETYKGDSSIQFAFTAKTEVELDHIKSALRIREVDLVELSRELEETKAQLALVQAKAMAEVAQIKQMALEKEMRLKSADQALANLKKVEIEYWGEGGGVQLAGSFNGWQHFIAMEPDPNSEIAKSDGSRGPMIWGTELWLYPGIYEIKFIVDGNWQIDQRREVMMQSTHQNNILRVEP